MRSVSLVLVVSALVACLVAACSDPGAGAQPGAANGDGGTSGSDGGVDPDACVQTTCEASGANCGRVPDGCGSAVRCASCATGETCGGAGTANVCGVGSCTPKTCVELGADCGTVSDGCGDVLSCGACGGDAHCGGGGANVCGTGTCTPKTCADQKKDCGTISDGCAATIDCGACSGAEQCGAGSLPNVCATPCPLGCPTGYRCGGGGVCVGGNPGALVLDAKTVPVTGTITLNGAVPASDPYCTTNPTYTKAIVHLVEATFGYTFDFAVPCSSATFAWSGVVYPGTYRVSVNGANGASNVPSAPFVVKAAQEITAASTLPLDAKTLSVGGTITLNGAVPASDPYCTTNPTYTKAIVHLVETTFGYSFDFAVPCSSTTFAWSGVVYPGTYRVSVNGANGASNVPSAPFVVKSAQVITAASTLPLDAKTLAIGGTITLNGTVPASDPYCTTNPTYTKAIVHLVETTFGYSFDFAVPCSSTTFAWSGVVYPGTYRVSVNGANGASNVPSAPFVVKSAQVIMSAGNLPLDAQTLAITGLVTLNGVAPTSDPYCTTNPTYTKAIVHLVETTFGYSFDFAVPCSSTTFAWSGVVYPGTYRVSVNGANGASNVPSAPFVVRSAQLLTAATTLSLDAQTLPVSGSITLNGAAPTSDPYCTTNPTYTKAIVHLVETTFAYSFDFAVPCSSSTFVWSGVVYPGTYRVSVNGANGASNVPSAPFVVKSAQVVKAASTLALDAKTLPVAGTITLNGAMPMSDPYCSTNPTYTKAIVHLVETSFGYTFDFAVPCSSTTFAWSGVVYPGTYRVSVNGANGASNVPSAPFVAVPRIAIP